MCCCFLCLAYTIDIHIIYTLRYMYITRTSDLRFLSWNGKTFNCTCTLDSTELCLCFSTLAELQISEKILRVVSDIYLRTQRRKNFTWKIFVVEKPFSCLQFCGCGLGVSCVCFQCLIRTNCCSRCGWEGYPLFSCSVHFFPPYFCPTLWTSQFLLYNFSAYPRAVVGREASEVSPTALVLGLEKRGDV